MSKFSYVVCVVEVSLPPFFGFEGGSNETKWWCAGQTWAEHPCGHGDGQPTLQPSSTLHRNNHSPAKQVNSLTTCAKSARLETVVENSRPCPVAPLHSPASSRRAAICLLAALENIVSFSFCFFLACFSTGTSRLSLPKLFIQSLTKRKGDPRGKGSSW